MDEIWKRMPEDVLMVHIFSKLPIDLRRALGVPPNKWTRAQKAEHERLLAGVRSPETTYMRTDDDDRMIRLKGNITIADKLHVVKYGVEYEFEFEETTVVVMDAVPPDNADNANTGWDGSGDVFTVRKQFGERTLHRSHILRIR